MTEKEVNQFEKTLIQLKGIMKEIKLLFTQDPHSPIKKFKLNFINQIIRESNELLGDPYKPFIEFDKFDVEDDLTASDVSLILEQYLISLERLRCDNVQSWGSEWRWVINGEISKIKTQPPSNFIR